GGISDRCCFEALAERAHHILDEVLRNERASYRGTLLPRLRGHLARHFLHEEIELFRAWRRVRRKHREIQRVGLLVEAHAVVDDRPARLEHPPGVRRARERHDALAVEMADEVARAAA